MIRFQTIHLWYKIDTNSLDQRYSTWEIYEEY
jgi:hypothetical protein